LILLKKIFDLNGDSVLDDEDKILFLSRAAVRLHRWLKVQWPGLK